MTPSPMDAPQPGLERLVTDTFAAHEHLAPHPDAVMAGVQQRITGRRPPARGALAIAAGIAVVAVVGGVSGVAAVAGRHHAPSHHPAAAADPTAPTQAPSAAPSSATTAGPAAIATLRMPFDLGWLPPGDVTATARRINVGGLSQTSPPTFGGEYMLTVTGASGVLDVDVQQMPGGLDRASFKSGRGDAVTIAGRAGIESANSDGPGGYEVYFLGAAGGLMYVNVAAHNGTAAVPADQLATAGRSIAENVRFPGTTEVSPTFGVGYVPAGLQLRAFDVETHPAAEFTTYDLGTTTELRTAVLISETVIGPDTPTGTAGRVVQGHPTTYRDDNGYLTLYILDAVHGRPVLISTRLPLSEIYQIADGLVLPE